MIDLRSDTVTQPTPGMRQAMAVGTAGFVSQLSNFELRCRKPEYSIECDSSSSEIHVAGIVCPMKTPQPQQTASRSVAFRTEKESSPEKAR